MTRTAGSEGSAEQTFEAIAAAGKEQPNPEGDAKARKEQSENFNDEPRLISQAHRQMRMVAFGVFGGLSVLFLLALLWLLCSLFSVEAPLFYVLARQGVDWHVWLVVGLALVVFTAVPLSLAMALMRMISHAEKEDDSKRFQVITPQIEMLKIFMDALKQVKAS